MMIAWQVSVCLMKNGRLYRRRLTSNRSAGARRKTIARQKQHLTRAGGRQRGARRAFSRIMLAAAAAAVTTTTTTKPPAAADDCNQFNPGKQARAWGKMMMTAIKFILHQSITLMGGWKTCSAVSFSIQKTLYFCHTHSERSERHTHSRIE